MLKNQRSPGQRYCQRKIGGRTRLFTGKHYTYTNEIYSERKLDDKT